MIERPFDARFALLGDRGRPASSWRTVSLVTALREFLIRDPDSVIPNAEQHCELLNLCSSELTARGLDANSLIRYGLFPEVIAGVIGPYIVRKVSAQDDRSEGPPTLSQTRAQEWDSLLDERLPEVDAQETFSRERLATDLTAALGGAVALIGRWVQYAPLADVIALRPPSTEWLDQRPQLEFDATMWAEYRWAVERFSVTSLQDWSLTSLHREYQWVRGETLAPCAEDLMLDRHVDTSALEGEIARRAVAPARDEQMPEVRASLAARMQSRQPDLLRARRFQSEAALFEFAVAENPNDAAARNNLGFCLLPHDADEAWPHLRESARLGYEPFVVNLYNRVLCLALLGDAEDALRLAEEEWGGLRPDSSHATLWRFKDVLSDELTLVERVDPVRELAQLGAELATRRSDSERAAQWLARTAA